MEHQYKGYVIVRNGMKFEPWNIYRKRYSQICGIGYRENVGYGKTLKECKAVIDSWEQEGIIK